MMLPDRVPRTIEDYLQRIDQRLSRLERRPPSGGAPPGVIMQYGGAQIPAGWLLVDGREVSRETYSRLFEAIGTRFGAGDGLTTFNLPTEPTGNPANVRTIIRT